MSDRGVRVEVTFNEKKHAEILEAMKQYGSQAGFLKFAAVYFINATKNEGSTAAPTPIQSIQQPTREPTTATPAIEQRRKLPPGVGGQAFTSRMKDE